MIVDPLENPSLSIEGLTDILFSGASDIKFEYDIQIGNKTSNDTNLSSGILIEKESLDKLSESSEIKLGMFIDLPIIFTVKPNEKGYASFDYELIGYQTNKLSKMDILLNGDPIDALSSIVYREFAYTRGNAIVRKLKEVIPRQNYEVALQAAIGARIIARETIGAYRKDVTVKIHTGDRDRKAKLLEKQKRGKARMKRFGKVDIPSEAFTVMLKRD